MHRETDIEKYLQDLRQAVVELRFLGAEEEARDAELTMARLLGNGGWR